LVGSGSSGVRIWKFRDRIGSEIFAYTPYLIRKFKIVGSDIQSETAHSIAYVPKYFVVSILPHGAKVLAILPLVRQNRLKWSCDKYDMHKKT